MYYRTKLKYYPVTVDMDWIAEMCSQYGTLCEIPAGCNNPAVTVYGTNFSLIFICEEHESAIHSMSNTSTLDYQIADHMRELMLTKSYVHLNNRSEFALEQQVQTYQASVRKAVAAEKRRARNSIYEIRKRLEDMGIKIGDPDEELRTARQRQFERTQKRQSTLGSDLIDVAILPVPSNDLICELF